MKFREVGMTGLSGRCEVLYSPVLKWSTYALDREHWYRSSGELQLRLGLQTSRAPLGETLENAGP